MASVGVTNTGSNQINVARSESLKDVTAFYSNAWSMLMVYLTVLIAFVGFVLPHIMKREFKNTVEVLKNDIQTSISEREKNMRSEIEQAVIKEARALEERFAEETREIRQIMARELARARGMGANVQAAMHLQAHQFRDAMRAFTAAAHLYLDAEDDLNFRDVMRGAIDVCAPKITLQELAEIRSKSGGYTIKGLIEKIREMYPEGRYGDYAVNLQRALAGQYVPHLQRAPINQSTDPTNIIAPAQAPSADMPPVPPHIVPNG
jgi:hypothetical protein